mmetsp:Transcript_11656/g.29684  ORF Transcript_11656/g.29684 Transcript_11656/m.29684 type:complete len:96 (-) Transcript_11656:87-374(-)
MSYTSSFYAHQQASGSQSDEGQASGSPCSCIDDEGGDSANTRDESGNGKLSRIRNAFGGRFLLLLAVGVFAWRQIRSDKKITDKTAIFGSFTKGF